MATLCYFFEGPPTLSFPGKSLKLLKMIFHIGNIKIIKTSDDGLLSYCLVVGRQIGGGISTNDFGLAIISFSGLFRLETNELGINICELN